MIKEKKCFYYWQLGHIIANYFKSITKAAIVSKITGIAIDYNEILEKMMFF